jgi:DNA mismatch repair protein MutS2
MDKHTIQVLEFDKVLNLLGRFASTEAGRERILSLRPLSDESEVKARMSMISEMKTLHEWNKNPSVGGFHDVTDALARAKVPGAVLDPGSLLHIGETARVSGGLRHFFSEHREDASYLWNLASSIANIKDLERAIDKAIDEDTNVRDDASPGLRRIRREKARVSARISSSLSSILAKENLQSHLRDGLVTIRNGRYVIPVKADSKSRLDGIVHDTSQSGATVFIEPMATVELNNSLRRLELEEKDEIVRILSALTDLAREHAGEVAVNLEILTQIDLINAGARFSLEYSCREPGLNNEGQIVLKGARHPLLIEAMRGEDGGAGSARGAIVPLDMKLGDGNHGLLITGPNAGGKTVALKTVGLLILIARTGFHIPCDDGSEVALMDKVYADIGDEQSIELSLSTFTSHMKNIIEIMRDSGDGTLVLLDEVGAGTDPLEGAALARTIIEDLLGSGARVVATTHHMSLKVFAHDNELLENASMEFDTEGLKPTYRLIQGVPGASHAFEIAARLGFNDETLNRAREYSGEEGVRFEELTRDLLERMRRVGIEEANAEAKARKADEVLAEYERRLEEIKRSDRQLRKQALKEAKSVVDDARRTATRVVKELKKARPAPEEARLVEKQMREKSGEIAEEIEKIEEAEEERRPVESVAVGERVYVKPLSREGVVISEPDEKGRIQVVVGALRAEVGLEDLLEVETGAGEAGKGSPGAGGAGGGAQKPAGIGIDFEAKEVSYETDVRGMTAEDAWEEVDKYLDDAALFGHASVRIIHGKGMGILAAKIKEMLSTHPRVKSHRLGETGEGGTGVTIVELEQ